MDNPESRGSHAKRRRHRRWALPFWASEHRLHHAPWFGGNNGYVARFSRAGIPRWSIAVATDNFEDLFDVQVGPTESVYFSGQHDGGTFVGAFELPPASSATLLPRVGPARGDVIWAMGHGPNSNSTFGLRRFLADDDDHIHFTSTTPSGSATRFDTNSERVVSAGYGIRMSLVDGPTGALLRERAISSGLTIFSNNFALLGTDGAAVAGSFAGFGTLAGLPVGCAARDGPDHYVIRVARLLPPRSGVARPRVHPIEASAR